MKINSPGSYLTDEHWADIGMCSGLEVEKVICAAKAKANGRQEQMQKDENCLVSSDRIYQPTLRTESVCNVQVNANRGQKRKLDGL